MANILLLEDDQSFGYILSEYLLMQNFQVDWVKTGEEALKNLDTYQHDLAILDIMLPGIDGFEIARTIKEKYSDIPFIFLSARSLKIDKLKGFKLGAYDYVTKPIDEEVLVAKIRALLGQIQKKTDAIELYQLGNYRFYPSKFRLVYGEEIQMLTARETDLLTMMCAHRGELMPRKKALVEIWGSNDEFSRKSMDVFISHLRKYLAKDPRIKINNIHGKGFILTASEKD